MKHKKILILSLLIFVVLSQFVIFSVDREPWFDVAFSLETVHLMHEKGPFSIDWRHYDVHSPLFYFMLYGWSFLNPGLSEYHFGMEFSVFIGVLFFIFAFIGLTEFFGRSGAIATLLLSACSTYVHYGTEVRSYIVVMLLSAMVFASIAKGLERKPWRWLAYGALFLMPLVHYLAVMAAPFFVILYVVVQKKRKKKSNYVLNMTVAAILGTVMALWFALPQSARTEGTFFQPEGVSAFPAALFYGLFFVDNVSASMVGITAVVYVLFLLALIVGIVYFVKKVFIAKKFGERSSVLALMFLVLLYPAVVLSVLFFGRFFVQGGLMNLYHPKFFLVVTWMFAAMIFVVLADAAMKRWSARIVMAVVIVIIGLMFLVYVRGAHYELKHMMQQTPCPKDNYVVIGHESAFSSIPYEVWGREYGCKWFNFISTGISVKRGNGGGFDAIRDSEEIFYNNSLPDGGFYYVQSDERTFNLSGRKYKVIAQDDGVRLLYVRDVNKSVNVNITLR